MSKYDLGAEFLLPRMREAASPRESLLLFISGSVELYAVHPSGSAAAGPTSSSSASPTNSPKTVWACKP